MDISPNNKSIDAVVGKFKGYDDEDGYPEWDEMRHINPNDVMNDEEKYLSNEMENFANGNYEYEPNGRGWHLKDGMNESIRRAIRDILR